MHPITILYVAANPSDTRGLDLMDEVRDIIQEIRLSVHSALIRPELALAARPDDLIRELNRYQPSIIHFSGHGNRDGGILLQNDARQTVTADPGHLAELFATLDEPVRVVVLNACNTARHLDTFCRSADCAIGMDGEIADEAARVFARVFYGAVGSGRPLTDAFRQAKCALPMNE